MLSIFVDIFNENIRFVDKNDQTLKRLPTKGQDKSNWSIKTSWILLYCENVKIMQTTNLTDILIFSHFLALSLQN